MYGSDSEGWFFGLEEGLQIVKSQEGYHQGDVMGPWLYCVSIQPFLRSLRDVLGDAGFIKYFIDDGNVTGDFDGMVKAIEFIKQEGPKYGYTLNLNKGTYLLGRCGSDTALARKNTLMGLGLSESIIVLHPDDEPSSIGDYGVTALGSYIGSDLFICSKLARKVASLEEDAGHIKQLENHQLQNLLLRLCFSQMSIYLQRTVPPRLMNKNFVGAFEEMKRSILSSILDRDSIPDRQWIQACLPLINGGLGYSFSSDISHAAYVASFHECRSTIAKVLPQVDAMLRDQNPSQYKAVRDFAESINHISRSADDFNFDYLSSIKINKDETLQHFISQIMVENRQEVFFS
jgi:hypothetical protein